LSVRRSLVQGEESELSVRRQCRLLCLPRSTLYHQPQEVSSEELAMMRLIDEQYLKYPFLGSRMMADRLCKLGHLINRKRVQRLMRVMGLESLAPKPDLSRSHPEHVKYPYLLREIEVTRANQVWAADVTYIPMAAGFVYLVAVIDWFSRAVLAWRLSTSMEADFCVRTLEDALTRWGQPDIFNTDQGVQFTSEGFTHVLIAHGIRISMDGKGRCLDNVFIERLWRSLKYEEVFLHAYDGVRAAKDSIGAYFVFFNEDRGHQSLGYRTPMQVYAESLAHQRRRAA
jgi:putative transposase